MAEAISVSGPISGADQTLSFETGKLAPQSQGAVVGRIGDTMVLVTANAATGIREGIDFFPLTVDIEERAYSAGKIPGSFFRREGRPTDQAILTCRLIDRPLRPSFAEGYRNETQVVGTILSADQENPHDVVAINAASAALMISGIPFEGPIGAVRIAWTTEGKWVPHPTYQAGDESTFELVVAGRAVDDDSAGTSDVAILLVEAGGTDDAWKFYEEGAPKVTEEAIAQGLEESKTWIKESIDLQRQLVEKAGVHAPIPYEPQVDYAPEVMERVKAVASDRLSEVITITAKAERNHATDEATKAVLSELAGDFPERDKEIKAAVRSLTKELVRRRIVEEGKRMDGRGPTAMGSVAGSSRSLMAAGVPTKAAAAGIALGLVYAEGKYTTLTDILGAEDAFGDMDFKVAGTAEFVTALQLDTKIDGLPADVLAKALQQARDARLQILDVMNKAIAEPRPTVAATAPKIVSFEIPMDKIGEVIGPKGKVINTIQQETGADINVDDDGVVGTVTIGSKEGEKVEG